MLDGLIIYCCICYLIAGIIGYTLSDPCTKITVHGLIPLIIAPLLPILFIGADIVEWATPRYREVERWALSLRQYLD